MFSRVGGSCATPPSVVNDEELLQTKNIRTHGWRGGGAYILVAEEDEYLIEGGDDGDQLAILLQIVINPLDAVAADDVVVVAAVELVHRLLLRLSRLCARR